MKVMQYDPSHEEVYNAFIMKPKPNRKLRFFLQNLLKPTDRKHFEIVTTLDDDVLVDSSTAAHLGSDVNINVHVTLVNHCRRPQQLAGLLLIRAELCHIPTYTVHSHSSNIKSNT